MQSDRLPEQSGPSSLCGQRGEASAPEGAGDRCPHILTTNGHSGRHRPQGNIKSVTEMTAGTRAQRPHREAASSGRGPGACPGS